LVPTKSTVPPPLEAARGLQQRLGLDQVNDVNPVQLAEYVAAHVRVPAPGLVAEVDSGLQQLFEACLWHRRRVSLGF
jgi:hypothetical protein